MSPTLQHRNARFLPDTPFQTIFVPYFLWILLNNGLSILISMSLTSFENNLPLDYQLLKWMLSCLRHCGIEMLESCLTPLFRSYFQDILNINYRSVCFLDIPFKYNWLMEYQIYYTLFRTIFTKNIATNHCIISS